jgi:hypothetical protein
VFPDAASSVAGVLAASARVPGYALVKLNRRWFNSTPIAATPDAPASIQQALAQQH